MYLYLPLINNGAPGMGGHILFAMGIQTQEKNSKEKLEG
jgi:hypothetical protein